MVPGGEVLVEIKATGVCHTDEFTAPARIRRIVPGDSAMKARAW
jgi:Zn-dependent alcohol dehydrogenase